MPSSEKERGAHVGRACALVGLHCAGAHRGLDFYILSYTMAACR